MALTKMMDLQYKVIYKKGNLNTAADALSRRPTAHSELMSVSTIKPVWLELVEASYSNDSFVQGLLQKLAVDPLVDPHYTLCDGLLCYDNRIRIG
jgi:hypothetical protein